MMVEMFGPRNINPCLDARLELPLSLHANVEEVQCREPSVVR